MPVQYPTLLHFYPALLASLLALTLVLTAVSSIAGPLAGCTDPQAANYEPAAKRNDGSCVYPLTTHTPSFAFEIPDEVHETSGLLFYDSRLWTFNDSGGEPVLYAIDQSNGTVTQRVRVNNVHNHDWEDITRDDTYLYVGDFGNNAGTRTNLAVYKVPLAALPKSGDAEVEAEIIRFRYPDQVSFAPSRTHNFDCEAMIAAGDFLYLFSKNRGDLRTNLYRIPKKPGNWVAETLDNFNSGGLVTGADFTKEHNEVILTGYNRFRGEYIPFLWLLFDFKGFNFLDGNKRRIELFDLKAPQVEGVTYTTDRDVFLSAEAGKSFKAMAYRFNTTPWTAPEQP
ncbi:hypothetical protein [Desulfobulbus alkaliphilus]|uniref:hypothetical protein n=1 Tax=Desulfobulbus alkaliphilus TaxID=869814 RepID=UPI0019622D47|nr:hypothetical protein [Desulfobulbus alkaliphilus]MBM9537994.1 hypothetical protein [Desulfobulbus alkaliphilus]